MSQLDAEEIRRAVELHFSGQLDEAERMYRSMLERFPENPSCMHMLGMLLHGRRDDAAAGPLLRRSLELAPNLADFHNNYALFVAARGKPEDAISHLKRAMELDASSAAPHENMGMVMENLGRQDEAAAAYGRALAIQPNRVKSLTRRAWTLLRMGRLNEAVESWQHALAGDPNYPDAHDGLCVALAQLRKVDEAILHGRKSVEGEPNNPEAWMNLGGALGMQSRFDEAIVCVERAIALFPNYVHAISNLAWLYKQKQDLPRSIELCQRALQLDPNSVLVLNQLSHSYHLMGDIDSSLAAAARAIQLDPRFVPAWVNLASTQLDGGDAKASALSTRNALSLQPDFTAAHSNLLLALNYDPDVDRQTLFDEHRRFEVMQVAAQGIQRIELQVDRNPERKLRIGYVSPDFRRHAVASFIEPVFRTFDRTNFETICYSDVRYPDAITQRLRGYASGWVETVDLSPPELAGRIAADRIDILVDLAGHTADGRLLAFAQKPAPVQVSYLGYLTTTGLQSMDYRITDSIADPSGDSDSFYTEKLIRLGCFFCYQPPEDAAAVGPLPMESAGRITFGSLNNPAKFNEKVLDLWARLLAEVGDAKLLLNSNAPGAAERRLIDLLGARGVAPDRIEFVYRQTGPEYFQTYNRIDIALDPFPFSGHTTSCDALWMGVPVVTMAGDRYASRTCASTLTHLGLENLVVADSDGYIKAAAGLAGDRKALADLRASLRQRMLESPLCNDRESTGNLEREYRRIWQEFCGA